ncbi:Protein CL16A [Dimargaris cristalligena]|nr:Protein CL16A [Dimargaris cristalligena]
MVSRLHLERSAKSLDRSLASFTPHSDTQLVIEKIRQLSEVLIYCDRHHPELLGYFLEKQMHHRFFSLLNRDMSLEVLLQFLQTLSIIVDSVKSENFMFYLLSNNYINKIILFPHDFGNDEVLAYYVSFLKTLSLRLNDATIPFFFNAKSSDFPLYTSAIRFFDHSDTMVRIAVKSITLNVYRTMTPEILTLVMDHPSCRTYFYGLIRSIRRKHDVVYKLVLKAGSNHSQMNQVLEEHLETIAYINDVFGLGVHTINLTLAQTLRTELLYPVLLTSLLDFQMKPHTDALQSQAHVSLVFLNHLVMTLKYPSVINEVATMLFSNEQRELISMNGDEVTPVVDYRFYLRRDQPTDALILPFISLCYFLLINKAISPSILAQTSLCPRRLSRTKDILHSLMGSVDTASQSPRDQAAIESTSVEQQDPVASGRTSPGPDYSLPFDIPSDGSPEQAACLFPHPTRHRSRNVTNLLLALLTETEWSNRPIALDLCATVLGELTRTADPVQIVCSPHTQLLRDTQRWCHDELRAYFANPDSDLGAVVSELRQLNTRTFEQRMFNAILDASVTFPEDLPFRHSATVQLRRTLHVSFFIHRFLPTTGTPTSPGISLSTSEFPTTPLSSATPPFRERQVINLDKHPHIPVVVHVQPQSQIFHGMVLSDDPTSLVVIKTQLDKPSQGTVVTAVPLADFYIERVPPSLHNTAMGRSNSMSSPSTGTSSFTGPLQTLGPPLSAFLPSRRQSSSSTASTQDRGEDSASTTASPPPLLPHRSTSSSRSSSITSPLALPPGRQLRLTGSYYRPSFANKGNQIGRLALTLHFKDTAAALYMESRFKQARAESRRAITDEIQQLFRIQPAPKPEPDIVDGTVASLF